MDGRAVFFRPEGRPSNAAKRDIVVSEREKEDLERTHRETALARRTLSAADLQNEIEQFHQYEEGEQHGKTA